MAQIAFGPGQFALRFGQGLALFEREQARQFILARGDCVGQRVERGAAFADRARGPGRLRGLGRRDGGIGIGHRGVRHLGKHFARRRVDHLDVARAVDALSVDQHLIMRHGPLHFIQDASYQNLRLSVKPKVRGAPIWL